MTQAALPSNMLAITPLTTAPNTTTLLLSSLPSGTHVGLDLSSFTSTASFRGIKLLPRGLHHIWTSTALGLRHGFWLHCTTGTHSLSYDDITEALLPCASSELTPELWTHGLTAYRQRLPSGTETPSDAAWQELVVHVTPALLTRLLGTEWRVGTTSVSADEGGDDDTKGLPATAGEEEVVRVQYTGVDLKRTWPVTAVGRERTEMARDRSWALERALSENPDLLGELEVAFVACSYLGNFASSAQWQRLVRLVLTCRKAAMGEREGLFVEFFGVLRRQIEVLVVQMDEGGFLGEEVLGEVQRLLKGFGKMLREEDEEDPSRGRKVRVAFGVFAEWVGRRMDWVLDTRDILRRGMVQTEEGDMVEVQDEGLEEEEETGEYAPAIVEVSRSPSPVGMQRVDGDEDDDPRF